MRGQDVRALLPELRRRVGEDFLRSDLARESGVSEGHISRLERGERGLTVAVAKQLAPALGLHPAELYALAGFEAVAPEEAAPVDDLVVQMRAILIRGRWPQPVREGIINLVKATRPGNTSDDGYLNAKSHILAGVH